MRILNIIGVLLIIFGFICLLWFIFVFGFWGYCYFGYLLFEIDCGECFGCIGFVYLALIALPVGIISIYGGRRLIQ